ncbi:MAG: class I SAM-dependent methyltransferase [bacterium]|nr:class I SAM-dependent methyltransferase [bacterium]
MKKDTSWGVETVIGHYQKTLILPNLLRLMNIKKDEDILDIGSGPGFFANEFAKRGAEVTGVELSQALIAEAKKKYPGLKSCVGSAEDMPFLQKSEFDKVAAVLALQNMDNPHKILAECARILKTNGKLYIVITHPAFRVLKNSEWGWDDTKKIQYRRIDSYLSESKEKIAMHPSIGMGKDPKDYTISFHRPLQTYFKLLKNSGFVVSALEEWESNKKSEMGPRAKAEDVARKEIPLFLFIEASKL